MSSSYVGSSGSAYGSSSSGASGGNSALTQSILSSVVLAGENVALTQVQPPLATPVGSRPIGSPSTVSSLGSSGTKSLLLIGVIALVGFFAYREL